MVRAKRRLLAGELHAELVLERTGKIVHHGFVGIPLGRPVLAEDPDERSLDHFDHFGVHIAVCQDLPTTFIEGLALPVGHVVVFEQVLADVEVAGLDLLLRVFDDA